MSDVEEDNPNEDIHQRHRREKKELQAKITALKKSATKGDKKKKKEVQDEINKLETDLETKHAAELSNGIAGVPKNEDPIVDDLSENVSCLVVDKDSPSDEEVPGLKQHRITKAQRRREKKAMASKERELRIIEQEGENVYGARNVELETIKKILKERDLMIHDIPSDGNCLYCAVDHQLGAVKGCSLGVAELRHKTGTILKNNPNEYLPFLSHPDTGEMFTEPQYFDYCNQVMATTAWGGQVELRALSEALKCGIEVVQAEGPSILVGEAYCKNGEPRLVLTYHRNMYSLGEHYNSVEKYRDPPEGEGNPPAVSV